MCVFFFFVILILPVLLSSDLQRIGATSEEAVDIANKMIQHAQDAATIQKASLTFLKFDRYIVFT
jgi:hypothetical protein